VEENNFLITETKQSFSTVCLNIIADCILLVKILLESCQFYFKIGKICVFYNRKEYSREFVVLS